MRDHDPRDNDLMNEVGKRLDNLEGALAIHPPEGPAAQNKVLGRLTDITNRTL